MLYQMIYSNYHSINNVWTKSNVFTVHKWYFIMSNIFLQFVSRHLPVYAIIAAYNMRKFKCGLASGLTVYIFSAPSHIAGRSWFYVYRVRYVHRERTMSYARAYSMMRSLQYKLYVIRVNKITSRLMFRSRIIFTTCRVGIGTHFRSGGPVRTV